MTILKNPIQLMSIQVPPNPLVSIVIPVYNEEEGLDELFLRLYPALDKLVNDLEVRYEVIFINDGSKDNNQTQNSCESSTDPAQEAAFFKEICDNA